MQKEDLKSKDKKVKALKFENEKLFSEIKMHGQVEQ